MRTACGQVKKYNQKRFLAYQKYLLNIYLNGECDFFYKRCTSHTPKHGSHASSTHNRSHIIPNIQLPNWFGAHSGAFYCKFVSNFKWILVSLEKCRDRFIRITSYCIYGITSKILRWNHDNRNGMGRSWELERCFASLLVASLHHIA